ncbi:MAG: hypothetical protein QW281_01095 [Saccharolobus sp.]
MVYISCIDKLHKAYILTWLGDNNSARKLAEECIQILSESNEIRRKIRKIKSETNREYIIAKKLRENNILTTDLMQLALYYLAKRILKNKEVSVEIIERDNIKMSVINTSFISEIRGYCEGCKGYKYSLLTQAKGYFIIYDEILYAEFLEGNINNVIDEIVRSIKL